MNSKFKQWTSSTPVSKIVLKGSLNLQKKWAQLFQDQKLNKASKDKHQVSTYHLQNQEANNWQSTSDNLLLAKDNKIHQIEDPNLIDSSPM